MLLNLNLHLGENEFFFKFDPKWMEFNFWKIFLSERCQAEDNKVMERGRFVGGLHRRRVRFTAPVPKTPATDEQSLISSCFCLLWGQNRFFYNQRHYWIPSSLFLVMHLITCCSLNIETLGDVIVHWICETVRIKVDGVTSLELIYRNLFCIFLKVEGQHHRWLH